MRLIRASTFYPSAPVAPMFAALALTVACGKTSPTTQKDGGRDATHAHDAPDTVADSSPVDTGLVVIDGGGALPTDVLTQRVNNSRTGIYSSETILTPATVASPSFGRLFSIPVDGDIYAQPLYLTSYSVGGNMHNVLIVATTSNSVFAFDADTGDQFWHDALGTPVFHYDIAYGYNDYQTNIGVTATPVIDRANGILYVANKDLTAGGVITNRLHVLSLATGAEQPGSPFVLSPLVEGRADDAATLQFDQRTTQVRPGLMLLNGLLYIAFGSHGDIAPYHGFFVAYQYDPHGGTLDQEYAWCTTQDGHKGSLWMGGSGPMVDSAGDIYLMVANGDVSVQDGGTSYGQAFVKLSPTLQVKDWFVPGQWEEFNEVDQDVGSGGPIMVPGTKYVVGAGKPGTLYVVDSTNFGHMTPDNTQLPGYFQITNPYFGTPVLWRVNGKTRLFAWGVSDPMKSWAFKEDGTFNVLDPIISDAGVNPKGADPVAILSLSTNGETADTAVRWANKPQKDPNQQRVPGVLYAFDPATLKPLWNSGTYINAAGDTTTALGTYGKFVPPVVANGKVYIPGSTSTSTSQDAAATTVTGVEIVVFGMTQSG